VKAALHAYFERLDRHLAETSPAQRIRLIDDERRRVDRLECALADWTARTHCNAGPPTRFSAFDLAILHGELSIRLERARESEKLSRLETSRA